MSSSRHRPDTEQLNRLRPSRCAGQCRSCGGLDADAYGGRSGVCPPSLVARQSGCVFNSEASTLRGRKFWVRSRQSAVVARCHMSETAKTLRIPFRKKVYFDQGGEVHLSISGERGSKFALSRFLYAPKPKELREMLLEIRVRCQWSQALTAAMLGISKATLRRWEDGSRNPCRAATKLIWLMHLILTRRELPSNAYDWLMWGRGSTAVFEIDSRS